MIFDTLAAMADRANDNKDNFNSTFQQTKAILQDVDNDGLNGKGPKQLINFGTKSGNCPMHGKEGEYKHYLVGMQQKQPQSVIQRNIDSSSSSSSWSSSSSSSSSNGAYVPTLQCAGGTEPSMVVTVTGASGTVDWLGKTWNLPQDSGLQQEVCPTSYDIVQTGSVPTYSARNTWIKWVSNNDHLQIGRRRGNSGFSSKYAFIQIMDGFAGGSVNYRDYFLDFSGSPTSVFNLGLITPADAGQSISDYRITDNYFGSHTVNDITYTWERGTNW